MKEIRSFILLTSYYQSLNEKRNTENIYCLRKNLDNKLIEKIILVTEESEVDLNVKILFKENEEKLIIKRVSRRPLISDFFEIGNKLLLEGNFNLIVSNSDIYFNETLDLCQIVLDKRKNTILALTRWDLCDNGKLIFYNNPKSQDAWIYNTVIDNQIGCYALGEPACDNKLLYEMDLLGLNIQNPSLNIQAIHYHLSNYRTYEKNTFNKSIIAPYKYCLPHGIVGPVRLLLLRIIKNRKLSRVNYNLNALFLGRYRYYKSIANNSMMYFEFNLLTRIVSYLKKVAYSVLLKGNKLMGNEI